MCGIAGWFGPREAGDAEALRRALAKRGPDGSGIWVGEGATLVHTRLAILDLSDAGHQPMERRKHEAQGMRHEAREEGETLTATASAGHSPHAPCPMPHATSTASTVLVFNGEIYNYRELRADLEVAGEKFTSDSDTEVLLRLLVREGEACLPKLAGMFAFSYWDEVSGGGLLARDPLGIKPLYYREESGTLSFSSEARVLRQDGDGIDATALRDFFLWGSVPEPTTLNAAVRQLPAGHLLKWKKGESSVEQWYPLRTENQGTFGIQKSPIHNPPSTIARKALEESMRRHLVSDVPVGIFLSGGIDSTVVLALTRHALGPDADIRTFSIGFDDPEFDESGLARRTAEHFGARHTEWRMTSEEGAAEIPAFLAAVDQPSIDGFNTWCVSKLARREGMKVVLSGLGGDEFFAGYGSFDRVPKFHRLHRLAGPMRGLLARGLETRPAGSPWRRLAAFLRGGGSWLEAFHAQRGIFTADEARQLAEVFTGQAVQSPPFEDAFLPDDNALPTLPSSNSNGDAHVASPHSGKRRTTDSKPRNAREIVSEMEVSRYMRNQLLRDSDVFSMAHGLELRVPLVDARLAEALYALPPQQRLRQGKQLLLEAVPEVPEWVKNQQKRGFRFPFQQWMEGQFGDRMEQAKRMSPVALNAWYRIWAVASTLDQISSEHP